MSGPGSDPASSPSARLVARMLDGDRLAGADCVVIATDHRCVDYKRVVELAPLVVDTRNATRGVAPRRNTVVKL